MPRLNEDMRERIIRFFKENCSQRDIANKLGISKGGVQRVIEKFKAYNTLQDMPKCGRPKKYSVRDERFLIRESQRNPKNTARGLQIKCPDMLQVSLTTVKRILRKYGLFGRIAAKRPKLNNDHIKKRLSWCRLYGKTNSQFWSDVIFSDECKIELYQRRREYVRRPISSRYKSVYTTKTVKFGCKSLMVWGAIKSSGERYLIRSNGIINSVEYQRILSSGLLPHFQSTDIFQQDNAPCHTSNSTTKFLEENFICYICDWPAQSPDLNIIEPMWKQLKDRMANHSPNTLDELWSLCCKEWNEIPSSFVKKLFESMPRRIANVIQCKGGNTKY